MAELKKFLFDNFVVGGSATKLPEPLPEIVDEDEQPVPLEEVVTTPQEIESAPQEVIAPVVEEEKFTREEMENCAQTAEKKGYEQGYAAAKQEQEQQNNELLTDISQKLTVLLAHAEEENQAQEQEMTNIIKQALQAIVPTLLEDKASELVSKFLSDNFNNFKHNAKLSFYIHPDIISYVQESIIKLANSYDFEGKIAIHKDSSLEKSSCRVEWDDGGVEYAPAEQLSQVQEMLDKQ